MYSNPGSPRYSVTQTFFMPFSNTLPANRGSAMGGFVAFLDIAYGLAGPGASLVAGQFGYAAVYLLGTASALLGAALVIASRSTQA